MPSNIVSLVDSSLTLPRTVPATHLTASSLSATASAWSFSAWDSASLFSSPFHWVGSLSHLKQTCK